MSVPKRTSRSREKLQSVNERTSRSREYLQSAQQLCHVIIVHGRSEPIRIRSKGTKVHLSLVEDQSVLLGPWYDFQPFGCGVPGEKMWIDDVDISTVTVWVGAFVKNIIFQNVEVELGGAMHGLEGKATHLAAHIPLIGRITIILRPSRHELCDVVVTS